MEILSETQTELELELMKFLQQDKNKNHCADDGKQRHSSKKKKKKLVEDRVNCSL